VNPGRYNITVVNGTTFALSPQWLIDNLPVNLTGYSADMQVRDVSNSGLLTTFLSTSQATAQTCRYAMWATTLLLSYQPPMARLQLTQLWVRLISTLPLPKPAQETCQQATTPTPWILPIQQTMFIRFSKVHLLLAQAWYSNVSNRQLNLNCRHSGCNQRL